MTHEGLALPEFIDFQKDLKVEAGDLKDPAYVAQVNVAMVRQYLGVPKYKLLDGALIPSVRRAYQYVERLVQLATDKLGEPPKSMVDIGCGSNLILSLVGHQRWNLQVTGTEADLTACTYARKLVKSNELARLKVIWQVDSSQILANLDGVPADFVVCNPPFHESQEFAKKSNARKWAHLKAQNRGRNFGGQDHELIYPGGERGFAQQMIRESKNWGRRTLFSCLISRQTTKNQLVRQHRHLEVLDLHAGKSHKYVIFWMTQESSPPQD